MLSVHHNAAIDVGVASRGKSCILYKLEEVEELRKIVRDMSQECFSRKVQLRQQIYESKEELRAKNEELNAETANVTEIEAKSDAWKAEWEYAKYKNFWKRVHRKHIMEDLTDLKKHQQGCFNTSKDILLSNEVPNVQNISIWSRMKNLFTNLLPRSIGDKQRKERRSRRNEKFNEIVSDLEDGANMVDGLAVVQYCTYYRQAFRNKD